MKCSSSLCSLVLPSTNTYLEVRDLCTYMLCETKKIKSVHFNMSRIFLTILWYNNLCTRHTFHTLSKGHCPKSTRGPLVLMWIFIHRLWRLLNLTSYIYCFGKLMHFGNLDGWICHSFVPTLAYCWLLIGVPRENLFMIEIYVCCGFAGYAVLFGLVWSPMNNAAKSPLHYVFNAMQF